MDLVNQKVSLRAFERKLISDDVKGRPDEKHFITEPAKPLDKIRDKDIKKFLELAKRVKENYRTGIITVKEANENYHSKIEKLLDKLDNFIAELQKKRKDLIARINRIKRMYPFTSAFVLEYIVATKDYYAGEGAVLELEAEFL